MTDRIPPPIRRPATARPRGGGEQAEGAASPPPTTAELAAVERSFAGLPRYSGAEVWHEPELGVVRVRLSSRGVGYNYAACPRWRNADIGARLAQLGRSMLAEGEWPALIVAEGVSQPPALAERLAEAGWVALEGERIMWTRRAPGVPHLDPSLRLEAVTPRTAAEFERLEREVFGLPVELAAQRVEHLVRAVESSSLRAYLVWLHGEAVATTRLTNAESLSEAPGKAHGGADLDPAVVASIRCIFGVAVVPAHRRRGLGTLVTSVATRAALASGGRLVWLSVDERNVPALRVYRRLGYQPAYAWTRWVAPSD